MKGDFTRLTFDPRKHYRGAWMQQGRVQLDADWNENLETLLHRIDTETIDVIGECGVPVHDAAFGMVTSFGDLSAEEQAWLTAQGLGTLAAGDFYLTQGRAYVDGILVEVDHTLPFSQQPFVLPKGTLGFADGAGDYQLYLDVWERHITALEDPSIREVALGGPDTATRRQVVWQAMLAKFGDNGQATCSAVWPGPSTGTLSARTTPVVTPDDPCPVPPGAGYKRLENQLYRVEIHQGSGGSGPTFKWSRDNGSVVVAASEFPIAGAYTKIRTTSLGRDDVLGLHENDWVEVLDDERELSGQPGDLVQIQTIEPDNVLVLSASVSSSFSVLDAGGKPTHLKVRRWDSSGAIAILGSSYIALEGGVEVSFDTTGTFRTGDYWLIPARTVPGQYGDIEWPQDSSSNPLPQLPFGIVHHTCSLAVVSATSSGASGGSDVTVVQDCRQIFPPLTELPKGGETCCSVTVGQGGDYPDIHSALAARPASASWWTICILPGVLTLTDTLAVSGASNLTISGCGNQSRVVGPSGPPVFTFTNCQEVKLEGLRIDATAREGAILFSSCDTVSVVNCSALNMASTATLAAAGAVESVGPLIIIDSCQQVVVRDNYLVGLPAVRADGMLIDILGNRIMGGGVQIIAPSRVVEIADNLISSGMGPGIQLGGGNKGAAGLAYMTGLKTPASDYLAGIAIVTISRNLMGDMQGSGIVTDLSPAGATQLADVEMLVISDNQIISCGLQPDVTLSAGAHVGGGMALLGVFTVQISHNFIGGCGGGGSPACGIFILDGSDIDIDSNTIVENGVEEGTSELTAYQAGIAAQYVYGNIFGGLNATSTRPGYPALRIRGNEVVCPAGQALTVAAIGAVMVEGNTLSSRGVLVQPAEPLDFGKQGKCVYILDLGLPVWAPASAPLLQALASGQTSLNLADSRVDALADHLPDGHVMFHDNQVTFITAVMEDVASLGDFNSGWFARAWAAATFSALLVSLDDISVDGSQFQAVVPLYTQEGYQKLQNKEISAIDLYAYLLKFIHVGAVGIIIRGNTNGLEEPIFANYFSYVSNAVSMNVTTNNEATHAFATLAPAAKKVEANNLSIM